MYTKSKVYNTNVCLLYILFAYTTYDLYMLPTDHRIRCYYKRVVVEVLTFEEIYFEELELEEE